MLTDKEFSPRLNILFYADRSYQILGSKSSLLADSEKYLSLKEHEAIVNELNTKLCAQALIIAELEEQLDRC